jgi:putative tricarboxylic transport membrane protein
VAGAGAPRRRPFWLGGVVVALGLVWIQGALAVPRTATYAVVGPGVFPLLVGIGLVALGALLLAAIARGAAFEPQDAEDADPDRPASWRALGLTTAAGLAPVLLARRLGFPVAAAVTFALTARAFGSRRPDRDLALGLALGAACWVLFSRLLGLALPGFPPLGL